MKLLRALNFPPAHSDKARLASIFFDTKTGLLRFLRDSCDPDNRFKVEKNKCRELLLKALAKFVASAATWVEGSAASIVKLCYKIYKIDQNNAVKQAAFQPIKAVLSCKYPRLEQELQEQGTSMETILEYLKRDLVIGKKATHSQTLKANLLNLLAMWAETYPHVPLRAETGNWNHEIVGQCEVMLGAQFSKWQRNSSQEGRGSGAQAPDFLLMAGCIK